MSNDAREVAQLWADLLTAGNAGAALDLLADDVRYEMIGTTPISGVCHGKAEFLSRVAAVVGGFPEPPAVRCTNVIADGDRAVVLGAGRGRGPHGPYVQGHYAWAMRVAGGRVVEMIEFVDTVALELAAFGRRLTETVSANSVPVDLTAEDREGIRQALYFYCRGVDRCDREALSRAYWPEAIDDHGDFVGTVDEFIELIMRSVPSMRTHHMVGNVLIEEVGPGQAAVESYYQATHRLNGQLHTARDWTLIGRYLDRFERRGGEWRILHRRVVVDWERCETPASIESGFSFRPDAWGGHHPLDPLYRAAPDK